jgi:hypothetical protein
LKGKNCKRGKPCGSSCISLSKECQKDLNPKAQESADLLARTVSLQRIAAINKEDYKVYENYGNNSSSVSLHRSLGENEIKLELLAYRGQKGIYFEIDVNNKFSVDDSFTKGERIQIARQMREMILKVANKLPNGTLFWGVASGASEEHRNSLIRWYSKIGFKVSGGNISSLIQNGKLT